MKSDHLDQHAGPAPPVWRCPWDPAAHDGRDLRDFHPRSSEPLVAPPPGPASPRSKDRTGR